MHDVVKAGLYRDVMTSDRSNLVSTQDLSHFLCLIKHGSALGSNQISCVLHRSSLSPLLVYASQSTCPCHVRYSFFRTSRNTLHLHVKPLKLDLPQEEREMFPILKVCMLLIPY